ncbi:MAG TPA: cell division protein SepF [Mycobacteriales bacterium]|nr:cell division protein SepF [Mycobacteriales bacterium]
MSGAMRKLGLYLGLVEDDESDRYDPRYDDESPAHAERYPAADRTAVRGYRPPLDEPRTAQLRQFDVPRTRGATALDTAPRPAPVPVEDPYRITTVQPRTYNEARTIGEHFRTGTPVIMNLTEMDDPDAKRLVDFAAGLIFGLRGSIERVTNKVFLLSPEHVEVTAEDKARIVEGGFFNQS